jgi:hypothetical protein
LAIVKIIRDSGYADHLRAYDVVLDGNKVGEIGNGEAREFRVSSGQHDLSLRIDWCGSKVIRFTAAEGDVLTQSPTFVGLQ